MTKWVYLHNETKERLLEFRASVMGKSYKYTVNQKTGLFTIQT